MSKKHRWLWGILFSWVALILGGLATGWNVVLVKDYHSFVALTHRLALPNEISGTPSSLIFKMFLGSLGFLTALVLIILIFIRLLREMRLNQMQSEFLAAVSHELKTPIATLELSSSLIRAGGLTESEQGHLWHSHQTELLRLKEEVNTLLEAARWQFKPRKQERTRFNLENWVHQSQTRWRSVLGPHSQLTRSGDLLDFETLLDFKNLHLILDNLMNNARKFSRGSPSVTIHTRRFKSGRILPACKWQIQIKDQGWGFNPSDSKKIFNRFFRSRNPAPYAIPGTGLGLYLANSASQAMGLTLWGESEGPGKGATFILEGYERRMT